jgi:AraC family transcriptional regulator, regulatory protein of adaptative response / methylated-DNA-[protein]-cysteine methyltransferase
MKLQSSMEDYQRIEKAILFLENNVHKQPDLKEIARSVNLSEYHFHRLFKRWAGISPKRFLQYLTIDHAKQIMNSSRSLLDVAYESGLSGVGRLHNLFVTLEAMTPGEFRNRGKELTILYCFHPSPFGECFIAITERGICSLSFVGQSGRKKIEADFKKQWQHAKIMEDTIATRPYIKRIFGPSSQNAPLLLHITGTNFQIKTWQALLNIPQGSIVSYKDIAKQINKPKSIRAVANAVARNPVAFLIPCHRVIRKTGSMGGYRWGIARKKAMLAWEQTRNGQRVGETLFAL